MGGFDGCNKIEKAVIGAGLREMPEVAFFGCYRMKEVVLPQTLTHIGAQAFAACDGLRIVRYGGTRKERAQIRIDRENEDLQRARWICTKRERKTRKTGE